VLAKHPHFLLDKHDRIVRSSQEHGAAENDSMMDHDVDNDDNDNENDSQSSQNRIGSANSEERRKRDADRAHLLQLLLRGLQDPDDQGLNDAGNRHNITRRV
jgi:hypothetical protein